MMITAAAVMLMAGSAGAALCKKKSGALVLRTDQCKRREATVTPSDLGAIASNGPAGGDLSGSYPNPVIASGAITASKLGALAGAQVTATSQTIPNATGVAIQFPTPVYDTDGMFSASNADRLTVKTPGVYLLSAAGTWQVTSAGSQRQINVVSRTSTGMFLAVIGGRRDPPGGSYTLQQDATGIARLNAGEYVRLEVFQDTGAGFALLESTLSAQWLGP